jgi:hypothetical protein
MNDRDWLISSDPETLLRQYGEFLSPAELRAFACTCCRRLLHWNQDPIFAKVMELAENRSIGMHTEAQLKAVGSESLELYDALYPGYGAPSPAALALSAAGEAAFTEVPLTAAIGAASTAAMAVAGRAAEKADDGSYDEVHDMEFARESEAQAQVLKALLQLDRGTWSSHSVEQ